MTRPPPYRRAGVGRYPGDGRGNHHNRHPPPTPPHPNPVIPAPEPEPRGQARQPSSPTPTPFHRRAGEGTSPRTPIRGRYPGDGRGYPHKHPKSQTAHTPQPSSPRHSPSPPRTTHQHPPTVVLASIRHSGPRAGTQGGAATPQPSTLRHPHCHPPDPSHVIPERPQHVIPSPPTCHPERSRRTPFITNSPAIPFPLTTANARP